MIDRNAQCRVYMGRFFKERDFKAIISKAISIKPFPINEKR